MLGTKNRIGRAGSSHRKHTGFFRRLGRMKFTIMLVPHTEKRPIHFQISVLTILFLGIVFFGLLAGFFWFSLDFSGNRVMLASQSLDLEETEANLDIIRDEVGQLLNSAGSFKNSLKGTIGVLGLSNDTSAKTTAGEGDLASLFAIEKSDTSTLAEVTDLQSLRVSLDDSATALDNIRQLLTTQKSLLSDIPTIWPVKGVRGHMTQKFGPAVNPFGGYWYLHRGVDIAFAVGIPIMAAANGKVVKKDYDPKGFGYYIDIQHAYGFKTRYAHMQRQLVELGQTLSQGDVIGTMGNTGLSTGPHLHYEVMIGTQLVDPIRFLNMTGAENRRLSHLRQVY